MPARTVLQFVRAHGTPLLSGAVALAAIAVTFAGLSRDQVRREMKVRLEVAAEIDRLRRDPKNADCINAEQQRRQELELQRRQTLVVVERYSRRTPLVAGVFPAPAQPDLIYRFQEAYRRRLTELPGEMKGGGLPTEQEVQDELERLADQQQADEEAGVAASILLQRPVTIGRVVDRHGPLTESARRDPTAMVSRELAFAGAAARNARRIHMYATANPLNPSFDISPIVDASRPTLRELWYAQVGLWVQEDVVSAIRALNNDAARALSDKDANVAHLPVKRLVNLRVLGYVTSAGLPVRFDSRGGAGGMGPETLPPSFTGRKSDEQFDVIRFTVTAIVDQRDLLKLVDYLSRASFYQPISAGYVWSQEMGEAEAKAGYVYGESPVVQVTLDLEGYLARRLYAPMMPAEVMEELRTKSETNPR